MDRGPLKITNGEIHYRDKQIPFVYYIKKGNFETPGKQWNVDTMAFTYAFESGPTKGSMQGRFDMNFKTSDYRITDRIVTFDLKPWNNMPEIWQTMAACAPCWMPI